MVNVTVGTNNGIAPFSYTYNFPSGGIPVTSTNFTVTGLASGMYYVTSTDNNGVTDSDSIFLPVDTLDFDINQTATINCYGDSTAALDVTINQSDTLWSENFDGFPTDNITNEPGAEPNNFPNNWVNQQLDDPQDWYARSTATATAGTGPTADRTGGGNYVYVEDGFGDSEHVILETPLIDFRTELPQTFNYWVHSQTAALTDFNVLHVDVFLDYWDRWILDFDVVTKLSSTNTWMERNINIPYSPGRMKFRFRVENKNQNDAHDIAIDDISVTSAPESYTYNWSDGATVRDRTDLGAGKYLVTINNGNCNFVDSIIITQPQQVNDTNSISACETYTWTFNSQTYTASGLFSDTIINGSINGCDSIASLDLTINSITRDTTALANCGAFTWSSNGQTYAVSGVYSDTISNGAVNGCDSIANIDLTINQATSGVEVQSACNSFTWIDGITYTVSNNTAMFTITNGNSNGCDSIVTLNLTISNTVRDTTVLTNCGPFTWSSNCLLYTSPSPRDKRQSRMPSSA